MTQILLCVHKPSKLLRYPIGREEGKDILSPQVIQCSRCSESWYEGDPEPRVVLMRLEEEKKDCGCGKDVIACCHDPKCPHPAHALESAPSAP